MAEPSCPSGDPGQQPLLEKSLGVVLLGAGASSRMGRPKLLLPWGTKSILEHLLDTWRDLGVRQAAVVCAAGDTRIQAELDRIGHPGRDRIINPRPGDGMFSSIQTAARWPGWKAELTRWALVLGDQPHLSPGTLRQLLAFASANPDQVCQLSRGGRPRHPVIFPRSLFSGLGSTAEPTLKLFLAKLHGRVALSEVDDPGLDVDLDTPEAYDTAVRTFFISRAASGGSQQADTLGGPG